MEKVMERHETQNEPCILYFNRKTHVKVNAPIVRNTEHPEHGDKLCLHSTIEDPFLGQTRSPLVLSVLVFKI